MEGREQMISHQNNQIRISIFLAWRMIRKGNLNTHLLTLFILTLSIVNIIFVPSLLQSMSDKNEDQVIENQLGNIVIEPKDREYIPNANEERRKILGLPHVIGVSNQYVQSATITDGDKTTGITTAFVNPEHLREALDIEMHMVEGSFLSNEDTSQVLMGIEVAGGPQIVLKGDSLDEVHVGDTVSVAHANGIEKEYKVKGIFQTKSIVTDRTVFFTEKELEIVYGLSNIASKTIVRLDDKSNEDGFVTNAQLVGIRDTIYLGTERSSLELTETFSIIQTLIGGVAFIVSSLTLFIIIYINAVNRRQLIATLKAIGVDKTTIILSFVAEAVAFSAISSILALVTLYAIIVPYFNAFPLNLPFAYVSLSLSTGRIISYTASFIILSAIVGFIPAYTVSKKNIVETMRK